jgi:hypothetical protein
MQQIQKKVSTFSANLCCALTLGMAYRRSFAFYYSAAAEMLIASCCNRKGDGDVIGITYVYERNRCDGFMEPSVHFHRLH